MANRPQPKPGILDIAPYVPGRMSAPGVASPVRLASNESPLGASPKAVKSFRATASGLASYPDGSAKALRQAIGSVHGLDAERIVVGAGSDELLQLLARVYLGPGDEGVVSQYGFALYPIAIAGAGGRVAVAPETGFATDIDAVLKAVTDKTRLVFIANPNNPTGSYLSETQMIRLHAGLPADVLLVVDSAYAEYVTADEYEPGIGLVDRSENVVMVRTFSKMGLASLRVGWLYGTPELVDAVNRLRAPFNVSGPAQAAAAAAIGDIGFTRALSEHNEQWRDWLVANLTANWLRVLPSQGNFVLVVFSDEPGLTAEDADKALLAEGLVVRRMEAYGLPNALRISIGPEDAMRKVAEVLNAMGQHG